MERPRVQTALEKMRIAIDLFETAVDLQRQNLRRRHPDATEREIEERLGAWLQDRPGAELGNGQGRPARRFDQDA